MNPHRKSAVHLPAFPRTRDHHPAAAPLSPESALRPLRGLLLLLFTFEASTLLLVVTLLAEQTPGAGPCGVQQSWPRTPPETAP